MNDFDPTPLIHHPYRAPQGFEAPQVGVYKASTVMFENVAALRTRDWRNKAGYTYGLHGTPTTFTLEERIATLEGGLQSLLVPSGLAAIALVDSAPSLGRKGGRGRSYADAPEIDGSVRLLPPEKASRTLKAGEFTRVRIVAAEGHDLVGTPI